MNSENPVAALTYVQDIKVKIGHEHDASNDLSDFQEDVAPGLCYILSNPKCIERSTFAAAIRKAYARKKCISARKDFTA